MLPLGCRCCWARAGRCLLQLEARLAANDTAAFLAVQDQYEPGASSKGAQLHQGLQSPPQLPSPPLPASQQIGADRQLLNNPSVQRLQHGLLWFALLAVMLHLVHLLFVKTLTLWGLLIGGCAWGREDGRGVGWAGVGQGGWAELCWRVAQLAMFGTSVRRAVPVRTS